MKISNPTKFFSANPNDPGYQEFKDRATIMTRGDILRKFAVTDSSIESDWHFEENAKEDTWVKFSFDAGKSYPLKFKYKNTLLMKFLKDGAPEVGTAMEFDFSDYSDVDYSSIRNGRLSVYALNAEGYVTSLPCHRYRFNDGDKTLTLIIVMDPPEDSVKTMVTVELDGHSAMAMAVPTPVFSSFVGFTEYSTIEELDMVGIELSDDSAHVSSTNLDNVSKLYVKVMSADGSVSGKIALRVKCGAVDVIRHIDVTPNEMWREVPLPSALTGQLELSRAPGDEGDTLKRDGQTITCYLTNVKVVIFS